MRWHILAGFSLVCSVIVLAGCGSGGSKDTYKVTGTVKFTDGSPLTQGMVVFASPEGTTQGEIQADGSYSLGTYDVSDGAPAGSYKVFLAGPIVGSDGGSEAESEPEASDGEEVEMYDEGMTESGEALVHQKFSAPATSELTCEVSGKTTFDITVEKPE